MKFFTKSRYALRVMIELARHPQTQCIPLKYIAEKQSISLKYLEQIIVPLSRAGLVRSERGSQGGYRLALEPARCTAGQVLRAIEGSLAPVLQITIKDGEKMLYAGTAATLSRTNVIAADDILAPGERRDLTIIFHFPPESGNEVQDTTLNFTMCAEAVQVRNNPNRQFE